MTEGRKEPAKNGKPILLADWIKSVSTKPKEKKRKEEKGTKKKRKKIVRMRSKEEHVAELEKTEYRSRPINIQNKQKGILVLFGKTRVKKASEKVRKSPGHIAIVVAILKEEEGRAGDDAKLSRARSGEEIEREKTKGTHERRERRVPSLCRS